MTLVQKYCAKRFHLDKNYNYLVMVAPHKEKKQKVDFAENRQAQLAAKSEQLIQTRVAVEKMVIGWRSVSFWKVWFYQLRCIFNHNFSTRLDLLFNNIYYNNHQKN